jgi:hypothetical protein
MFWFLAFLLNLVDKTIWFIISFCQKKKTHLPNQQSIEIETEKSDNFGETKPRVHFMMKDKPLVTTPVDGCNTLYSLWENAIAKYKTKV